ncbi:hypothetical protein [Caminibacter sp.]
MENAKNLMENAKPRPVENYRFPPFGSVSHRFFKSVSHRFFKSVFHNHSLKISIVKNLIVFEKKTVK